MIKFKTRGPLQLDSIDMMGKLVENKKICKAHREHVKKVLAATYKILSEFDSSAVAKDKVTQIIITLNDKFQP